MTKCTKKLATFLSMVFISAFLFQSGYAFANEVETIDSPTSNINVEQQNTDNNDELAILQHFDLGQKDLVNEAHTNANISNDVLDQTELETINEKIKKDNNISFYYTMRSVDPDKVMDIDSSSNSIAQNMNKVIDDGANENNYATPSVLRSSNLKSGTYRVDLDTVYTQALMNANDRTDYFVQVQNACDVTAAIDFSNENMNYAMIAIHCDSSFTEIDRIESTFPGSLFKGQRARFKLNANEYVYMIVVPMDSNVSPANTFKIGFHSTQINNRDAYEINDSFNLPLYVTSFGNGQFTGTLDNKKDTDWYMVEYTNQSQGPGIKMLTTTITGAVINVFEVVDNSYIAHLKKTTGTNMAIELPKPDGDRVYLISVSSTNDSLGSYTLKPILIATNRISFDTAKKTMNGSLTPDNSAVEYILPWTSSLTLARVYATSNNIRINMYDASDNIIASGGNGELIGNNTAYEEKRVVITSTSSEEIQYSLSVNMYLPQNALLSSADYHLNVQGATINPPIGKFIRNSFGYNFNTNSGFTITTGTYARIYNTEVRDITGPYIYTTGSQVGYTRIVNKEVYFIHLGSNTIYNLNVNGTPEPLGALVNYDPVLVYDVLGQKIVDMRCLRGAMDINPYYNNQSKSSFYQVSDPLSPYAIDNFYYGRQTPNLSINNNIITAKTGTLDETTFNMMYTVDGGEAINFSGNKLNVSSMGGSTIHVFSKEIGPNLRPILEATYTIN